MRANLGTVIAAAFTAGLTVATPAIAAELPAIKTSDANKVADCATPGRLTAYLKSMNPNAASKFDGVATEYMRHGEELGVRWDYAYFQMLLETGYLKYTGDVKPEQNNFAGLGATGRGARGESFKDVSTGARAHLEHLLMYSGQRVESPVAERTRNIQDWGVLTSWQKTVKGPVTYTQLAKQWAPTKRGYASDIAAIAQRFFDGACKGPDSAPELVAAARSGRTPQMAAAETPKAATKGDELAQKALDEARLEGTPGTGLGAKNLAEASAKAKAADEKAAAMSPPALSILNADANAGAEAKTLSAAGEGSEAKAAPADAAPAKTDAKIETAALAGTAKSSAKSEKAETPKEAAKGCKVWTASYGGTKAVIIKAATGETTNYTVLDVNDGSADREAEAYIAAYAQGGTKIHEFPSQDDALSKAFELCPEG